MKTVKSEQDIINKLASYAEYIFAWEEFFEGENKKFFLFRNWEKIKWGKKCKNELFHSFWGLQNALDRPMWSLRWYLDHRTDK